LLRSSSGSHPEPEDLLLYLTRPAVARLREWRGSSGSSSWPTGVGPVATAGEEYDAHAELRHAIEHMRARAYAARPAELFLHRLDGSVERIETV
jgi:hypothetical protein